MKLKRIILLSICLITLLIATGGTYAYENNFSDNGLKKQCVLNYIKDTNKGIIDNKYKTSDFGDLLFINLFKTYEIQTIEPTNKTDDGKMKASVIVHTTYINNDNENNEMLIDFTLVKENDKYKIEEITKKY